MLRIGIIGYGRRISNMAKGLDIFDIPYKVTAVADPRGDRIQADNDPFLAGARFHKTADELLAGADELDGVMIGTRCNLHTEMAIKVAPTQLPLFLEKPVAITFDEVRRLHATYKDYAAPTVVSFPLRLSPVAQKVREIIESDQVGSIEQVVAFNDVGYGSVYFRSWYRNYEMDGGLWLQKFTHDVDYINYLLDARPRWVSAMNSRRVYGGDKAWDLQCKDCPEQETCPESPFVRFRSGFEGGRVRFAEEQVYRDDQFCVFSEGHELQDNGSCMLEYENGVQVSYTQNFFTRYRGARRGARLYGYRGIIEFNWSENYIKIFSHTSPVVETIDFSGDMPHFGGDRELSFDFLMAMRDRRPSRSPIDAGILSALTCLWARESANNRQGYEVVMPEAEAIVSG
ncbi:MAG: Gfo/Idh/MocA family oxidoreductase [Caldilineaceae bacterium SB0665_bin_25]|nr:Gfo/Idh/MocA family oxidoreductase [Caldilineaceae bacterium SB0665_bin_25]